MQISGEIARYELSHLNLFCLQKPLIVIGNEKVDASAYSKDSDESMNALSLTKAFTDSLRVIYS